MGSSEGPHQHFEFPVDSKTEKIINPMLFGYDKNMITTKTYCSQQFMFNS
jgi:hypothetical protein